MSTSLTRPAPVGGTRPRWRLGRRTRTTFLVVHILAAGVWIGVDVVVAVLVVAGRASGDAGTRAVAYQALGTFILWPMLLAALTSLVTGVVLGLAGPYGLVRHWWVAVKLGLNLVLCVLIVVLLRPALGEVTEHGRALAEGIPSDRDVSDLFFPPAVSLSALTLATVLAVAKPWGRTRGRRRV